MELILGSGSPRRQEILQNMGLKFSVLVKNTEETYPADLEIEKIPEFLSKKKSDAYELKDEQVLLTADTVVILNGEVLNKPKDKEDAKNMLASLSGKKHAVITAFTLKTVEKTQTYADRSEVYFKKLTNSEIEYYVENCNPLDKAGAYGVQDFIGLIGIEKIEGSFYTVMGLPAHLVYTHLNPYL
jgi:septum formation protein